MISGFSSQFHLQDSKKEIMADDLEILRSISESCHYMTVPTDEELENKKMGPQFYEIDSNQYISVRYESINFCIWQPTCPMLFFQPLPPKELDHLWTKWRFAIDRSAVHTSDDEISLLPTLDSNQFWGGSSAAFTFRMWTQTWSQNIMRLPTKTFRPTFMITC